MSTDAGSTDALPWPQKRTLGVIYDAFRSDGDWPTFQYLSSQVWTELESEARDLYYELGQRGLVRPVVHPNRTYELRNNTKVAVTLRGLTYLDDAAGDLAHFVSIVRYIAERAAKFQPQTSTEVDRIRVTSEEVRLELRLDDGDSALERAGALIRDETWALQTSFNGPNSGEWSLEIEPEKARRYREIHTVIDFLDRRDPKQQREQPSMPASPTSFTTHPLPTVENPRSWLFTDAI